MQHERTECKIAEAEYVGALGSLLLRFSGSGEPYQHLASDTISCILLHQLQNAVFETLGSSQNQAVIMATNSISNVETSAISSRIDDTDILIEQIPSETADNEMVLPSYKTSTYPADYTLEVLVDKWKDRQIVLPDFQRAFVWGRKQSSRLIDSFLKGLPVPPVYLFKNLDSRELLVVDGHQRVQSIVNFFEGYFDSGTPGERQTFGNYN